VMRSERRQNVSWDDLERRYCCWSGESSQW